jgi:hypothetical protein
MSRKRQDEVLFPGVSVEGGFISGDALQDLDVSGRISAKSTRAGTIDDFLAPASFDLIPPDTLEGVCQRSFEALKPRWQYFSDNGGPVVRLWLSPLLNELQYGSPNGVTLRLPGNEGKEYQFSGLHGAVPLLLVDSPQDLDKPFRGKATPHGLVQEFLNKSKDHLFGIVSNGRELRLLRDNARLTRPAYIGFDLEGIFSGNEYASFALMYRLLHSSRLKARGGHRPEDCLLEAWLKKAGERSSRAMEHLREGVRKAIEALGKGFLIDPEIATALREKQLTPKAFNHELLRLVYRFLFLLVAEERDLLFPPGTAESKRQIYLDGYSVTRLRLLAQRSRGSSHHDLYESIKLVFCALVDTKTAGLLGLTPLGGLFKPKNADKLHTARLTNEYLLQAMRNLTLREVNGQLRPVDFLRLGTEELGSIYEQLLQLEPYIDLGNPAQPGFEISSVAGNERKVTGSYYTPDNLVQCLLDSALEPVMAQAVAGKSGDEAAQALLKLTICDPACGSGHFLVSAGRRLALRVAEYQAGGELPSAAQVRHAFRQVAAHCLYGVDINDMAIELAKIALWMEAMEPGKPLSFLDHHFRVGNSLLGVTPRLLEEGLPDEAFTPITGDDRATCMALKRRNKEERDQGVREFQFGSTLGDMSQTLANLDQGEDESLEEVIVKENRFKALETENEYRTSGRLLADAWCAAFVWRKCVSPDDTIPPCPTTATLEEIREKPHSLPLATYNEIRRLAQQYGFFHWYLEFPKVFHRVAKRTTADNPHTGWSGGFDCLLGNPPWERVSLEEKQWFSSHGRLDIANAKTGATRKKLIDNLKKESPSLFSQFESDLRSAEGESNFLRNSGLYPLTAKGRVNLYPIFGEQLRILASSNGLTGAVMPSGIMTDDTTKDFFQEVSESKSLVSIYDFENRQGFFSDVDSRMKFCLFTTGRSENEQPKPPRFVFFAHGVEDLADPNRLIDLSAVDIKLLNPNTRTCPIFRSRADAELTKGIYRRLEALIIDNEDSQIGINEWEITFKQGLFNMTLDSQLFRNCEDLLHDGWAIEGNIFLRNNERYLPLYEGRMIDFFDHRCASVGSNETNTFRSGVTLETSTEQHENPNFFPQPRYWVRDQDVQANKPSGTNESWTFGFKDITSATNQRTFIGGIFPFYGVGNKVPLILTKKNAKEAASFFAGFSCFALDFVAKQKVGGVTLNFFLVKQFAYPKPGTFYLSSPWCRQNQLYFWILQYAIELTYTAWDLMIFAKDCGYHGPPFCWLEDRRFLLRVELDAAFFHLYLPSTIEGEWKPACKTEGCPHDETPEQLAELKKHFPTPRDAVAYIMDTFPIVRRKDEEKYDGDYRTKRVILEIYDAMQEAIRTGKPYQTRLDPPPGPPTNPDGSFATLPDWQPGNPKPANWPSHIHPPRGCHAS